MNGADGNGGPILAYVHDAMIAPEASDDVRNKQNGITWSRHRPRRRAIQ